jgi:arginyl-tRNA synthetase
VLFEIMKRLERPYAKGLFHLSYGMVDLPTGKMKSREGTVVDADDLIQEVIAEAELNSQERGTLADLNTEERKEVLRKIGLAALKFFIVKVHPKKRMTFDPKESVDMQGQTGPYVQNAYVRCSSMLSKADNPDLSPAADYTRLETAEKDLIAQLYQYPETIVQAAAEYDPSMVASYAYDLAKSFHRFWHDFRILQAESEAAKAFRIQLSMAVRNTLRSALDLLGIEAPEKM